MAAEQRRGCGYRKISATYLEGDPGRGYDCGRLPLPVRPCPLCDQRPAFTRNLQRITPANLLHVGKQCAAAPKHCAGCPLNEAVKQETAGLMWVGEQFYTPEEFTREAVELGASKRVSWPLPKWFKIGKTWVFLAHGAACVEECVTCRGGATGPPRAVGGLALEVTQCEDCNGAGSVPAPGAFHIWMPLRAVRIIPDTMPGEERRALWKDGLTLVAVPADDPDHQPAKGRKGDDNEQ